MKSFYRSLYLCIAALALLTICTGAFAQDITVPVDPFQTNVIVKPIGPEPEPPTVQGGAQEIINAFESGNTNWWFEAHGLYAPGLKKKYGGGVGAFWNVSQYVYTGVRVDSVNGGFWMPSGSATLQLPLKVTSWLSIAPIGYAGIGVPLSGATVGGVTLPGHTPRDNNGQPTAILGYGGAIRIANINASSKWSPKHIDLIGDRETWSGFPDKQWRFGLTGNWQF